MGLRAKKESRHQCRYRGFYCQCYLSLAAQRGREREREKEKSSSLIFLFSLTLTVLLGAHHPVDPLKAPSFLLKKNLSSQGTLVPPKSLLKLVINPSSQQQCHCKHTGFLAISTNKFIVKRIYFGCPLFKVQHNILLPAQQDVPLAVAAVTNWAAVG